MLEIATDTVYEHMLPLESFPAISTDQPWRRLQRIASESGSPFVLVYEPDGRSLLGYARTHELLRLRGKRDPMSVTDPLPYFRRGTGAARAIFEMERVSSPAGVVMGRTGQPIGVLTGDSMVDAILGGDGRRPAEPVGHLSLGSNGCSVEPLHG